MSSHGFDESAEVRAVRSEALRGLFGGISETIGMLPVGSSQARGAERVLSEVCVAAKEISPAAVIASLRKLREMDEWSSATTDIAHEMFAAFRGKDHRVCESAIDLLRREDPFLPLREPYLAYANNLSDDERHQRDRAMYQELMRRVKLALEVDVEKTKALPQTILATELQVTVEFHWDRFKSCLDAAPEPSVAKLRRGYAVPAYLNLAFEMGFPHAHAQFRSHHLLNETFQRLCDVIDGIFHCEFPIEMTISGEDARRLISEVTDPEPPNPPWSEPM